MKKLFLFLPFIAFLLLSCKPAKPTKEFPIFTLKYENADLKDGQTIEVSKFDSEQTDKLLFEGYILCEETFNLEVTATREVIAGTTDDFCVFPLSCIPGQNIAKQDFVFNNIELEQSRFYAHFEAENAGNYKIIYDFHSKEKKDANIKISVIYKYFPGN